MSKIAVYGPSGMLGRNVVNLLGDDAVPVYRRDLFNLNGIRQSLEGCDGVINCAGVIPVKNDTPITMIDVNSRFPHLLSEACRQVGGIHVVLVSTDCVFSGRSRSRYQTTDNPDPRDYYGRSKVLGEVLAPHVCVVRTSFIGCDHGLMSMVLQAGQAAETTGTQVKIDGYKNALWTGSTVGAVAVKLIEMLKDRVTGIQHLATERSISKFDLLVKLVETNNLNIVVNPQQFPIVNRSLQPTVLLPNIDDALREFPCRQLVAA